MTVVTTSHIVLDERGVAFIEGTQTRVVQVVLDKLSGLGPEEIQRSYPYLSLAKIYAALTYYYDHQSEFDTQIARDRAEVEKARETAMTRGNQPTRAELERRLRRPGDAG